jgi:ABC-2 type transport system permease protein
LCAIKDLLTFVRDPMQWSQMAILFGLLFVYVLNMPRLTRYLDLGEWRLVVSFLNLATVALILATFTGRFVFPLVSLDAQLLWLVGTWPMPRRQLLRGKLFFSLTITSPAALAVVGLSARMLELTAAWAMANVAIITAVCVGLCGLSVGLGARFAVLDERNPARIAGGIGGTINLITSVAFVCLVLGASAFIHWRAADQAITHFDSVCMMLIAAVAVFSCAVAIVAMRIGTSRLETLEA